MGVFFTDEEECLITIIEELNDAVKQAKIALEYQSSNESHLIDYYRTMLHKIAASYDTDITLKLYAVKNQITVSEAPTHMLKRLNNQ